MSKDISIPASYAQGIRFQEFLAAIKLNKERFADNYGKMDLSPDDVAFFCNLSIKHGGPIKVLAIVEDWCPDAFRNLPILAKIADTAKDMELRIFFRDKNIELMEQYLTNGCMSIPTFVFFDQHFKEIGRWVERPKESTRFMQEVRQRMAKPGMTEQELRESTRDVMEEEYQKRLKYETVRELREVLA